MTQSKSDLDFLNGLHLMIDSIESSYLVKHEDDVPEADHWCPDVQAWHTADHEPAQAPSVHVNVDNTGGDDPQSENTESTMGAWGDADEVEKTAGLASSVASAAAPAVGAAIGRKVGQKIEDDDGITGEYDQNTNLDRESQENSEGSIAEPFLNRYVVAEEEEEDENEDVEKAVGMGKPDPERPLPDIEPKPVEPDPRDRKKRLDRPTKREPLEMSFDKSIDILKIWGSVDRVLPKTELDIDLVDDISILKSFELDETTNVEDLVEGTLVYKMLVDRANRPTSDWWESSMSIAKSISSVDEPAFLSAYLYYDPDTFALEDFIDIEKAEVTRGKPQDLEMMPNTSGGSAIDGLGMSADGQHGPEDDKDCD